MIGGKKSKRVEQAEKESEEILKKKQGTHK